MTLPLLPGDFGSIALPCIQARVVVQPPYLKGQEIEAWRGFNGFLKAMPFVCKQGLEHFSCMPASSLQFNLTYLNRRT